MHCACASKPGRNANKRVNTLRVTLERIHDFDEIVDVRTPLEYAEDHIPGAINAPVLSNEERVVIGTLYTQSRFEATRLGAALVAKNIGRHLETQFANRPRQWRTAWPDGWPVGHENR